MTEATAKKSIAELMDGDKPGVLNLLLEHLLAPASPWRYMEPLSSMWSQYNHLTLQDFKEDCEWDEHWFVRYTYSVYVCNPCQDVYVSSKEEAEAKTMADAPEFDESDGEWYDHFEENIPTPSGQVHKDVRVIVSNLRLKESEYGQK